MFHGLSHWDIAFALGVILINLIVDTLAVIAVIGLMADEEKRDDTHIDAERTSEALEPLGLLLERKE